MSDPIKLDALLAEEFDTTPVPVEIEDFDEVDDDEAIDDEDWAPAPEFSDFEVWCPEIPGWGHLLREARDQPWRCYTCGATDHHQRDHEGD
jgi:hypothetical protein